MTSHDDSLRLPTFLACGSAIVDASVPEGPSRAVEKLHIPIGVSEASARCTWCDSRWSR
jgi:hypothetical protein